MSWTKIFVIAAGVFCLFSTNHLSAQFSEAGNDRLSSRMFFGYTADMLEKGRSNIQNIDLLFTQGEYALSNNFTVGAGYLFVPGSNVTAATFKFKLGTKVSDHVSIALSNSWILPFDDNENLSFVTPILAQFAYTPKKVTYSIGFGVVVSDEDLSIIGHLGWIFPINDKWSIVSENYWGIDPTDNTYEDNLVSVILGPRYHTGNWLFEVGVLNLAVFGADGNGVLPLPHMSATYLFP